MIKRVIERVQTLFARKPKRLSREPKRIAASEHRINRELVARQALRVCETLQKAGHRSYIVGGAVRDLLLGVAPKDFDVATDATPEQVKSHFRRAIIIGRRFRLVHVMFGQETIEVSTFRALENPDRQTDEHGRVLADNLFGEQHEDAARRDFSVNALYYDPTTREVVDYHDGVKDLAPAAAAHDRRPGGALPRGSRAHAARGALCREARLPDRRCDAGADPPDVGTD
jgi:poly(A) polymerase